VRVDEVPKPGDIAHDEVLVRNAFWRHLAGATFTNTPMGQFLSRRTRNAFSGASIPQILGHEFSGVIESPAET